MKKSLFLFAIFAVMAPVAMADHASEEAHIRAMIAEKNYCEVDSDCSEVRHVCPFGCDVPLNKKEVSSVQKAIMDHYQAGKTCVYECKSPAAIKCRDKKCVVVKNEN